MGLGFLGPLRASTQQEYIVATLKVFHFDKILKICCFPTFSQTEKFDNFS